MISALRVATAVQGAVDALADLGRALGLALLAESEIDEQLPLAREAARRGEQAERLEQVLTQRYGVRPKVVAWSSTQPVSECLREGRADRALTRALCERLEEAASASVAHATSLAAHHPVSEPVLLHLGEVAATLPVRVPAREPPDRIRPERPTQVLRGPPRLEFDSSLRPAYSLEQHPPKAFTGEDLAPSCCGLGMREAAAAALCALTSLEYDGFPLAFYGDMARQAWDEMRHARFFLDAGARMLSEFVARYPDHPAAQAAREHLERGTGLPAPIEGNHYELIWNADVVERLTLMHLDTEGPAVAEFRKLLDDDDCRSRPWFAEAIDLIGNDEAAHGRLGRHWLRHLLPDAVEREAEVAQARRVRGVLMLTSFARLRRESLIDLLDRYSARTSS